MFHRGRFRPALSPLTIPVAKKIKVLSHDNSILHKLLHAIDHAISIPRRHQPAATFSFEISFLTTVRVLGVGELLVSHGDRGLVRYREHAHPATEDAERVDGVERLRASRYLRDG